MFDRRYSKTETAGIVVFIHLFILILVQLENYFLYISPGNPEKIEYQSFIGYLGLLQFDNILIALILGCFAYFCYKNHWTQSFYCILVSSANLYLILDQVAFKIFFDHARLNLLEGSEAFDVLISSALAELDIAFYVNVFLFVIVTVVLAIVIYRPQSRLKPWEMEPLFDLSKQLSFAMIIVNAMLVSLFFSNKEQNGHQHAFTSVLADLSSAEQLYAAPKLDESSRNLEVYPTRFSQVAEDVVVAAKLHQFKQAVQKTENDLNIILIVMESVGSLQLLNEGGLPSKTLTPTLHKMSENSIIFDNMYSVYPATVLSHVALNTGGVAVTLGNVHKDLTYYYQGPTLNKALRTLGYETALYSSQRLDYGNMAGLYKNLDYRRYFDFGESNAQFQKKYKLNSWGGQDQAVMDKAVEWVDNNRSTGKPFFLHFLTNATHHPYDVPDDFESPINAKTKKEHYLNTLAYSDKVIQSLLNYLQQTQLMDNTIIALMGDHGEAFAERHARNVTHKNYLYEENVKNFLMIYNPKQIKSRIISHRVATIGDVMPTLLDVAKAPKINIRGQSLLAKKIESRIVYFHKNSAPVLWGLRDGYWKFIDRRLGSKPELYNLLQDPVEKINLASAHADKIELYRKLISKWYIQSNNEYLALLKNYKPIGGEVPTEADLLNPGPKRVTFGDKTDDKFTEVKKLKTHHNIAAWVSWISFETVKEFTIEWVSPSREVIQKQFSVEPGWADTWTELPKPTPVENGKWVFRIIDNDKELLSDTFTVTN